MNEYPNSLSAEIVRWTPVERSPRVMQLEGMFEVPPSERSEERWHVSLNLPEVWNIGAIVGPSGSGKTTIAREFFEPYLISHWAWSHDRSILDDFPKTMSIKEIVNLLSSVGFSSPPNWVRPYRVLSNGEQFRVHIARTLAENRELAVVDEFTSVVDRTVAQIGSAAIAKTVRKRQQRLIAVSCHYDILDWLEPDWVFQPHTGEFYSGRYLHQRPKIEFTVRRVHHSAWKLFGKFHYLDQGLNKAAYCFCAFIGEIPVAFCAVLPFPHPKRPGWRFHRLVCLPDYQGVGIGVRFADFIASIFKATGKPVFRTLAHPAVIHACAQSLVWNMYRQPQRTPKLGKTSSNPSFANSLATDRLVAGFEYVGPPFDARLARLVLYGDKGSP